MSDLPEPPVNAIMRRADELLAAYDAKKGSGGGKLPESPYELLRESRHWVEELANLLVIECQDNSKLRRGVTKEDQMTDLEEALCNPLLVTDERFDLTRKAAAEIKRLKTKIDELSTLLVRQGGQMLTMKAEIERLEAAATMALHDLEQTYCHVSSVSADRIKSTTIPALRAALAGKVQP